MNTINEEINKIKHLIYYKKGSILVEQNEESIEETSEESTEETSEESTEETSEEGAQNNNTPTDDLDNKEKDIDPFSKKGAKKSSKLQQKDEKDIGKTNKIRQKKGIEFCKKEIKKLTNVFIEQKNKLDMPYKENSTDTWDQLLKTHKPKNIVSGQVLSQYDSYKGLIDACINDYGIDKIDIGTYGGKKSNEFIPLLQQIVDTTKQIGDRHKLYLTQGDLSGEKEKPEKIDKSVKNITNDKGRVIMYVKQIKNNTYKFRGRNGAVIFDSGRSTKKDKKFWTNVENNLRQQLGIPKEKTIQIKSGINTKGFDFGSFIVE